MVGYTSFNAKMDLVEFGVILEDRTPCIRASLAKVTLNMF